jgi:CheY-like chemotaxis protein
MTQTLGGQTLAGLSILVVEDEFICGLMLCNEIGSAGGIAIGPVNSVAEALREIEAQAIDLALLDAKLIGGSGADLAACLEQRGIPYVVVSGYEKAGLPAQLKAAPFVAKPISLPLLIEAIGVVSSKSRSAPPIPPVPLPR